MENRRYTLFGKKLINKKDYFLLQDALVQTQIGKPNEYGFIKL